MHRNTNYDVNMENNIFDKFGLKPVHSIDLRLVVYSFDSSGKRKEHLRQIISVSDVSSVPFTSIFESFRFLYPNKFVEFSTQL